MINVVKININFFLCFLIYLITGGTILLLFSKGEVVLYMNSVHNLSCDIFFKYFTFLGSGWFFVLIILSLAFYRLKYGLLSFICFLTVAITTQTLKHTFFSENYRPKMLLKDVTKLSFVDGVNVYSSNSFPSGHTTVAFSIFFLITLIIRSTNYPINKSLNNMIGLIFFILAFIVSISRIYLLQHFFVDTYFGAIIGIIITLICYHFFERSKIWNRNEVMNNSVVYWFKSY